LTHGACQNFKKYFLEILIIDFFVKTFKIGLWSNTSGINNL